MDDRFNTIAGWVLGAGIVALGASIVTAEIFKSERPDKMGYPIEGVVLDGEGGGGEAEVPIAALLATADAAKGEQAFKKCAACHTINQGGASGTGPNLWGTMGAPVAQVAGFPYSPDLKALGGNWDWERMNEWLKSPRGLVPGTKMSFAGLGKAEERANLMVWMNQQGSNLPLPPPPAVDTPAETNAAEAAESGDAQPAPKVPVPPGLEGTPGGGEGDPEGSGASDQEKN